MSRINTNVSSLIAQRVLRKNNDSLNTGLERLSTSLKSNASKDNAAGLIASENLRSEQAGISKAMENAGRAGNIVGTAEGGLAEVSSLLIELTGLVVQSAGTGGLSKEELAANQLQVDAILNTINRIAGATAFQGAKLLDQLRGRLGAFQKFTIGSTVNSVGVAYENASAAESAIRDTDFAEEMAKLTRWQILSQAATTVLARADSAPRQCGRFGRPQPAAWLRGRMRLVR